MIDGIFVASAPIFPPPILYYSPSLQSMCCIPRDRWPTSNVSKRSTWPRSDRPARQSIGVSRRNGWPRSNASENVLDWQKDRCIEEEDAKLNLLLDAKDAAIREAESNHNETVAATKVERSAESATLNQQECTLKEKNNGRTRSPPGSTVQPEKRQKIAKNGAARVQPGRGTVNCRRSVYAHQSLLSCLRPWATVL